MTKKNVMNYGKKMNLVSSKREFSDDSDCNTHKVMKFLSGSEERESSDDEDNANDDSDTHHGTWTKVGADRTSFPLSGQPGQNIDLEDPNNPVEYFELFIIPELEEIIIRETNQYAEQFLKNMTNLKLRSTVHHMQRRNSKINSFPLATRN
jgi:hypothetical protein